MSAFYIKTANISDLKTIITWAQQEGWNLGLNDEKSFYAADPKGFYIGLLDDEPIAAVSAVKYQQDFAFIGLYIVKPEYRGKKYGVKIMSHALKKLTDIKTLGLDGVLEQQQNYHDHFGFEFAHKNIRYAGIPQTQNLTNTHKTIDITKIPFNDVLQYDSYCFPAARPKFLSNWIHNTGHYGVAVIEQSKIIGFGVIRKCFQGYKVGPLFADNMSIAESIITSLCHHIKPEAYIVLDAPEINPSSIGLAKKLELELTFETARMYKGPKPLIDHKKIFGITTFELG